MSDFRPLQLLLATFAGWANRHQAQIIDYLVEENRVLKEQLGKKRVRLTDAQRRRLAAKGKALGRKLLVSIATIVTPDTILRWHRTLIAQKWTHANPRIGRPGLMKKIRDLIVRMATDNPSWGYSRIQGALKHVGHDVARTTVANVLRDNGIKPAHDRPTSWRTFIKSHADVIVSADFFTTEVWTARGLVTHYTLFLIDIRTRVVHIAGTTPNPNAAFMAQVARNLTDDVDGFLRNMRFLIVDRDTKFTDHFREILRHAGIDVVRTSVQAPNMNAVAERWVRSIKHECLNKMMFVGTAMLERAIREDIAHYHHERTHQGLGNELIDGEEPNSVGDIVEYERLGGVLRHYLLSLIDVDLDAPDHTTLSRRSRNLDVELRRVAANEPIHLVVDSTGLSIVGEGEWAAAKHGGRGKRGWKKLHLGVDELGVIIARVLTDGNVDDAKTGLCLIDAVKDDIASVTADAAYDTLAIYDAAVARRATVVIPPTKTAAVSRRNRRSSARDRTIIRVKKLGRRRWKKEYGYHRQGTVENAFFRYKSIIGDRLRARHPNAQQAEALVACNILNRMLRLGRPESDAVSV